MASRAAAFEKEDRCAGFAARYFYLPVHGGVGGGVQAAKPTVTALVSDGSSAGDEHHEPRQEMNAA